MSINVTSQPLTLSEIEIERLQKLAGSNDYVDFLNNLNLNVHQNVSNLTQSDIQKLYAHSESLTIIAFRNYFDKFFQIVHKKKTKTIALLLSQCLYLQLKTPDVRTYIDEERNNFLAKNSSDCTYKYGYVLGNTFQDIANKCVVTVPTVSKIFKFLETNNYITKQAVSNSIPTSIYKTDERVRIRLNLVNLFKDLICSGFNSLDELNLLPTEFIELYKDIRTVINYKNNMDLLNKQANIVDVVDSITVDTLIDCYNVVRKDGMTTPTKDKIKQNIDDILMTYNLPNIILAMDNYEVFRNITNRQNYMFSTAKFFTLEVINNFVDTNFINYLKQEKCFELTTFQINSGYKTLSSARAIVLQRKVKENNLDQIKLDTYIELINQYGIDNVRTPSTTVIDTSATNQDNVVNDDVKKQVDLLFNNEDTINYFTQFFYNKVYHKEKLELVDVINDAYIIACDLLQQNPIENLKNIKSDISLKLATKYSRQFKLDDTTISPTTNERDIYDFVSLLNIVSDDVMDIREYFDCSYIFHLEFSHKKILYQILLCLATSDDVVSNFAKEYKIALNHFYFNFQSNGNKNNTFNFAYVYQSKIHLIKRLLDKIKVCIDDYCLIQHKELLELFNEKDLLTDDLQCEVLIDNNKCKMSIEDIFLNNKIENASQIVHIPILHKKNSKFNKLLYYVAHKVNSNVVHSKVKERIK